MAKKAFEKFIDKGLSGAKKKEMIRQEKKKQRAETQAYFEKKKAERRLQCGAAPARKDASGRPPREEKRFSPRKSAAAASPEEKRPFRPKKSAPPAPGGKRPVVRKKTTTATEAPAASPSITRQKNAEPMPLNKFIAHCGLCSRRDAAEWIKDGMVTVNGQAVLEPGFKVKGEEDIRVNGKKIFLRRDLVYILLNKPKDYITTTEDPKGRQTVLDLVRPATDERVYPIGRLDRNTTGVLLLTNDGELAQKLSHPSYEIQKIYEVKLNRNLEKRDFEAIAKGLTLEDGFIAPDAIAYADPKDKSVIGIQIHSGRNRIVRRIFEHLGYDVRNLDRVMYANLTKKNVDRGKWRFLSEKEVRLLKFLNASYGRKKS